MKKQLFTLLSISLFLACNKEVKKSSQISTVNVSNADFVTTARASMKQKMNKADFNDLDWVNAFTQSIDRSTTIMKVKSKSVPAKALYYSVLDDKEYYYLVSMNLPATVKNSKDVDGNIAVYNEKNKPLWTFTIKNNYVSSIEMFADGGVVSYDGKTPDPDCLDCTLPPVIVMGYISSNPASFYSLFYTYGGGTGTFIQTPPGPYGSGGTFTNPYYDKYASEVDEISRKNIFVDINPNYSDRYYLAEVTKYATYTNYRITDNKSFWNFSVILNFQLDNDNKLIFDKTDVYISGFMPGSYVMQKNQNPAPLYNPGTLSFLIQGKYSYGMGSFFVPITVNVKGLGTSGVYVRLSYGKF